MATTITILDTTSGRKVTYDDDLEWNGDYIWRDGNFACDCNRQLFFEAHDPELEEPNDEEEDEEDDTECGAGRYIILSIVSASGILLYSEPDVIEGQLSERRKLLT